MGSNLIEALRRVNARHPWSRNDHFHSWIVANMPRCRRAALDIGCGEGELAAILAKHFQRVLATDVNGHMREVASRRCRGLDNVTISGDDLAEVSGEFDLITMVAVLHHLDTEHALRKVRSLLAPGGRFLVVGLAAPQSLTDHPWDTASTVTNPVIGYIKHPWPNPEEPTTPPFPVTEPTRTFDQVRHSVDLVMPNAVMRRRLGFRHTIAWTKPL
jgi:2-polyprenyl-3-methyl-5-hydroxy-6-metoxy-1,4-benzoquinol methylase